ncbi:MAG: cation:proton antiporter [Acidobacteriaceae bacterium]|nr:cation:proton antiporter [Acidobacteriaceae bacterium]
MDNGGAVSQIHVNDFVHVLLALLLVIAAARTLGAIFRFIHQPPVVGEMIAGILLGPSLLGRVAPGFASYILPHSIAPLLNAISQVGVILYMFLVGLELDVSGLRNRARSTILISHASIVTPFLLGAGVALVLYPRLSNRSVSFIAFSLFLGVSMSVTAFPVLARILTDRGIHKTKMGTLTLACAAIDDVSAWCLLAFVVSITQAQAGSGWPTLLMAFGYITVMLVVVRPAVIRLTSLIDRRGRLTQGVLAFVLLAILLSSIATECIGIHSIFGAFILGAIIPHGSSLARDLTGKLEDFVIVFLLPAFFAFTGLRTQIGLVNGAEQWIFCGLIILVASLGKFGGSALAAKFSGLGWRDASALGILMNTRGLMELIVLNIGLELHVISPTLFAMLVLMALATTLATTPVLHFITPRHRLEDEANAIEAASQLAAAANDRSGTLVPVSNGNGVENLLDLALSLTAAEAPPPRVLAMVRTEVTGVGSGVKQVEELPPSRLPVLAAALDAAWSRGTVIIPQAVFTTDPVREIVEAAEQSQVRWLLLESRRSMLGRYTKRGVVSKVLERAARLPVKVAVVLPSPPLANTRITCLVDAAKDGASVLELAMQIARSRQQNVQVRFITPADHGEADPTVQAAKDNWQKELAGSLETSSVVVSAADHLVAAVPEGLIVIGKDIVDRWQVNFDQLTKSRSIIVVQGSGTELTSPTTYPLQLEPVPA